VFSALLKVENKNRQGEYYLTDVVKILNMEKKQVVAFELEDPEELHGINDRRQLAQVQKLMQKKIIEGWMEKGVTFINPDTCMVDFTVEIGRDTVIYPGSYVGGQHPNRRRLQHNRPCRIKDTIIGNCCEIIMSQIDECILHEGIKVGPYSNLGPDVSLLQE
jgi:bifunctional UDP-N-acetylglucosamine pyrophosphorylase/glucosamine-1-phosphate N-acetyltransferase